MFELREKDGRDATGRGWEVDDYCSCHIRTSSPGTLRYPDTFSVLGRLSTTPTKTGRESTRRRNGSTGVDRGKMGKRYREGLGVMTR